jgi:hypothetical protein
VIISWPGQSAEQVQVRYAGWQPLGVYLSNLECKQCPMMVCICSSHTRARTASKQGVWRWTNRFDPSRATLDRVGLFKHAWELGRRLGGGIDRTAHLERRDWLTGTTFTWLLDMLGELRNTVAWKPGSFSKHRLGGLLTFEGEKGRDEGLVEKRKRQSGCPVRPRDRCQCVLRCRQWANGSKWMVASRARRDTSAVDTESGPQGATPGLSSPPTPASPFPVHAICEDQLLLSSSFLSTYSKKPFSQIHSFPFPRSRLLVDLILRSISHSTTTKHLKVARPASSISARVS